MSQSAAFGVNGRFLTQPVTGVQRYARAIVENLDALLRERGGSAPIFAPRGAPDAQLTAMPLVPVGPLSGHAWEQLVLPVRFEGRLLNLCNTAPAARRDQVVCIHDANVLNAPEAYGRGFRAGYRLLQPLLARRAAQITTVSANSAREIARYLSIEAAAIAVLPNGHEHALAWNPALARPEIVDEATSLPFVLALGSRAQHKNLRLLLDLAPALETFGLDLVIVGGTSAIFSTELLEARRNVRFTGYVTDHDLALLMERALCLAFPSWTEGFGLPVLEAMACGCPVVSSDRASLPEVCGDAALMAAPDDPATWIGHFQSLLGSQALREDLAGRGKEQARRFSWAESAAGYAELMACPGVRRLSSSVETKLPAMELPQIAVIVATTRRPAVVSATVRHLLDTQILRPAAAIISCIAPEDAGDLIDHPEVTVVTGRPGLAAQRNAALDALPRDVEIVTFFDDDFVADPNWLAAAARTFRESPKVVSITGHVLADDVKGPGLSFAEAAELVTRSAPQPAWSIIDSYSPYGCNMAFRVSAIGDLRFDERLVLYGWLEDRDFGAALAHRGGHLVKVAEARGVHMGVKSGRVAGERLGYSQIVNPIYMLRKGTMTVGQVAGHIFRNFASNAVRSASPELFIDRRGRLKGNLRGLADILRGQVEPERATTLDARKKG